MPPDLVQLIGIIYNFGTGNKDFNPGPARTVKRIPEPVLKFREHMVPPADMDEYFGPVIVARQVFWKPDIIAESGMVTVDIGVDVLFDPAEKIG